MSNPDKIDLNTNEGRLLLSYLSHVYEQCGSTLLDTWRLGVYSDEGWEPTLTQKQLNQLRKMAGHRNLPLEADEIVVSPWPDDGVYRRPQWLK